jgi:type IV pilus assembly protein PilQ
MIAIRTLRRGAIALALAGASTWAFAQNAIESVTANSHGSNVIVKIALAQAPEQLPIGFAITNPPRIALDFGKTSNGTGKTAQDMNLGDLRGVNVVQAGERSRLVFNLARPLNYATAIDGKNIILTIDSSGGTATAVDSTGLPAAKAAKAVKAAAAPVAIAAKPALRDLDFRRGANGEGRIVVDLPNSQVAVDVRQNATGVTVDFLKTARP